MPTDRTSHLIAAANDNNKQRRSFYRSFVQFLCSNLGLVVLVITYSVGGAFLFQLLEKYIELQYCQEGFCKLVSYAMKIEFFCYVISSEGKCYGG